uniref:Protein kinase domain-containing protein n=1 Tax=Oryza glumipatula TaxID=40148 RepID=A0A0E0B0B8_9ORYZ
MNFEEYKKVYVTLGEEIEGECKVYIRKGQFTNYYDGIPMDLSAGIYEMGPLKIPCVIKKGTDEHPITPENYCAIKEFRHKNAVVVENFFKDGDKGCLVLSEVVGTFEGCLRRNLSLAFQQKCDVYKFSPALREMIVDFCKVVENLLKVNLFPRNITLDNLYVTCIGNRPVMKVLIYDVEKKEGLLPKQRCQMQERVWDEVKLTINSLCKNLDCLPLHHTTNKFLEYIGKDTIAKLDGYPDVWTYKDKEWYLFSIAAADRERS